MKVLVVLVSIALVASQQIQQRQIFNTAVRLAGQGFSHEGSRKSGSAFNKINKLQGSSISSGVTAFQSQGTRTFQTNNQYQSPDTSSLLQNTFTASDSSNQNQQNTFSSTSSQGQNRGQFASSGFVNSSPQINNEVRFESNFDQQNSNNQFQTGNRLTPVSIQLTPSTRVQTSSSQQNFGTQLQTTSRNQNNQLQQSNFNTQTFTSNSQSNTNNQLPTGYQFQSSSRTSVSDLDDTLDGAFEPLNLPSGASRLLGRIDTSFSCVDRPYGYYADQENSCRVFHICNPTLFSDGEIQTYQYSFLCAKGTIFDQKEMICKNEFDATPCQEASNFYFRNEQFGRLDDRSL